MCLPGNYESANGPLVTHDRTHIYVCVGVCVFRCVYIWKKDNRIKWIKNRIKCLSFNETRMVEEWIELVCNW